MKKITILDYQSATVYVRNIPPEIENNEGDDILEYFAEKMNLQSSDCMYMLGDLSISIE